MCLGSAFAFPKCTFCVFSSFFFFFARVFGQFCTVQSLLRLLFMNSSRNIWLFPVNSARCALFTDPQITFFSNFFIKNESHDTIHTFKNYFATVFFSFSFQLYPNEPNGSHVVVSCATNLTM